MATPVPSSSTSDQSACRSPGDSGSTRPVESPQSPQTPRSEGKHISFAGDDARRKSDVSSGSDPHSSSGNLSKQANGEGKPSKRFASPPPPRYQRGVSFDTFDNRDASDFSFTLNYKHNNYQASRRSRTFLCGTDQNDYSEFALQWLIDELVDDGDEIICLRVVEKDSKIASDASVEEGRYRQEAEKLLQDVIRKNRNDEKAISLVLELAVGKVQEIIQRMIRIYEPAVLIVGTRGRSLSGMQGLLPGSVSKYCLQRSPIPVIVVRPTTKREKKKKKRLADPTRRSYNNILQLSEQRGSGLFSPTVDSANSVAKLPNEEAEAVADAVGLPRRFRNLANLSSETLKGQETKLANGAKNDGDDDDAADDTTATATQSPRSSDPNISAGSESAAPPSTSSASTNPSDPDRASQAGSVRSSESTSSDSKSPAVEVTVVSAAQQTVGQT